MKNIIISWLLPTIRQAGGPLAPTDIANVELELSADGGANFAAIGLFPPATLETPVNDLPFSDQYQVRGRAYDLDGRVGNWTTESFVLSDNSPPGGLVITVTVQ